MGGKIVVLLMLVLAGCEVAGQLTIFNDGKHEVSIGEVSKIQKFGSYPDSTGPGLMFMFKRNF